MLFRLVESGPPTLLLDEVDAYLDDAEELRGLLNAGHKRGARAYRCEGDNNTVRGFNAFAPAALAGIGNLPGTLHDRSIIIRLVRAKPGEVAARFDCRHTEAESELCRKLARWASDNFNRLENANPALPPPHSTDSRIIGECFSPWPRLRALTGQHNPPPLTP